MQRSYWLLPPRGALLLIHAVSHVTRSRGRSHVMEPRDLTQPIRGAIRALCVCYLHLPYRIRELSSVRIVDGRLRVLTGFKDRVLR